MNLNIIHLYKQVDNSWQTWSILWTLFHTLINFNHSNHILTLYLRKKTNVIRTNEQLNTLMTLLCGYRVYFRSRSCSLHENNLSLSFVVKRFRECNQNQFISQPVFQGKINIPAFSLFDICLCKEKKTIW